MQENTFKIKLITYWRGIDKKIFFSFLVLFGLGLFFGYEVIFDKFKISELRISESNVFTLVISSILVPLIFQIILCIVPSILN